MIVVVDYGMGNLRSVQKGFENVGSPAIISRDPLEIAKADRLVLPGVGAFPECMRNLSRLDLVDPILEFIQSGKPFLGICLGLQLLFDESEEFGTHEGFKVIRGRVKAFDNLHLRYRQRQHLRCAVSPGKEPRNRPEGPAQLLKDLGQFFTAEDAENAEGKRNTRNILGALGGEESFLFAYQSFRTAVSILIPYFSIFAKRVGRESPRSLAA
jgi:hypothetical protein